MIPLCVVLIVAVFIAVGSYWTEIMSKYQEKKSLEQEIIAYCIAKTQ